MDNNPPSSALRERLQSAMKDAMRAKDKDRLGTVRLMLAAIKQREIDERITLSDEQTVAELERMVKQRRESIRQYRGAGRDDLAEREENELAVIQEFMPEQLDDAAVAAAIDAAIAEAGATSMRDMGKVMGLLKQRLAGRVDMAAVSAGVKNRFSS